MAEAPLPALAPVEPIPVDHEGERCICITDPMGYLDAQLMMSPGAFFVAALMDGSRDAEAVQRDFHQQFGARVSEDEVRQIAACLEEAGFVEGTRREELCAAAVAAFRDRDTRASILAGRSYPEDPGELRAFLDEFFRRDGGELPAPLGIDGGSPLRGLVVPHIDLHRGGHVYAEGYRRLASHGQPSAVIIFGVAHAGADTPFTMTRKPFETPLGNAPVDVELAEAIASACAYDPFEHEFAHRSEHSIEFQALMLTYLYGGAVPMVPVLCSSVEVGEERVESFLAACRAVAAPERRITVLAAADLAHVGRRFGDDIEISDAIVEQVSARDHEDLAHVLAPSAERWHASVLRDGNARRVCGLGCMYAALGALDGTVSRGELHGYDYAHDPAGGIVSFASIGLS